MNCWGCDDRRSHIWTCRLLSNDSTDVSLAKAPENTDCLANGAKATAISSNHGHTLPVAKADIIAGFENLFHSR